MEKLQMSMAREAVGRFPVRRARLVQPYGDGRVNQTFLVTGDERYILQRLHSDFLPSRADDIARAAEHLATKGIISPRIIKSADAEQSDSLWRMQSFVPGVTVGHCDSPDRAYDAGTILGTFHTGLTDFTFTQTYPRRHNTPEVMAAFTKFVQSEDLSNWHALQPLATEIIEAYSQTPKEDPMLPERNIHGDPKITNVRFPLNSSDTGAMVDLDTLNTRSLQIELGDAARSWTNPAGEGNPDESRFSLEAYKAMIEGYRTRAPFVTDAEIGAIPTGIEILSLELSARFVMDAVLQQYFQLDPKRFVNLFEQNILYAQAQMQFYRSFMQQRHLLV